MLTPPPPADQAVSDVTAPLELSIRLVPPTPVTSGSQAGYVTWRTPSGSEPPSPEATNTDTPALARLAMYCASITR